MLVKSLPVLAVLFVSCEDSQNKDTNDTGTTSINCEENFCGCEEEVTIDFETTIVNAATEEAIEGISMFCQDGYSLERFEEEARDTSDANGKITFQVTTLDWEGCGLDSCENVKVVDPNGLLGSQTVSIYVANGSTITMTETSEE